MENDPNFANEVRLLAQEIYTHERVGGSVTQSNDNSRKIGGNKGNSNVSVNGDVGGDFAGRDLKNDNRTFNKRISLSFIAIAILGLSGYFGIKTNLFQSVAKNLQSVTQNSSSNSPTSSSQESSAPSTSDNEFDKVSFPQDSCGDKLPNSHTSLPLNLYPVYVKYTESNLETIKSEFCKDALQKTRETGEKSVQVASFTSNERAQEFKSFMIKKLGSGDVGKPNVTKESPVSTQPQRSPIATNSTATSPEFQTVKINCNVNPPAKFLDLNFPDCHRIRGYQSYWYEVTPKNYSGDWYEVVEEDGSSKLIGPGEEYGVEVKSENGNGSAQFKRYSGTPLRTVTVACSDKPREIWKLTITPRCNSTGTYIEIESGVVRSTVLTLPDGTFLTYTPMIGGSKRPILSGERTVTFTLSLTT